MPRTPFYFVCLLLAWRASDPLPCFSDEIYLNAEGQKNREVLRLRIAPAPIFDHPQRNLPYIRCIIVGERPARDPSAPYKSVEGSPEYEFVAFDASGDQRSSVVTISYSWIDHIQPHYDSDLDVRSLFSNRDQLAGVALGSRAYFAMARRAADPQGKLGLWRNDMQLPLEPENVREGGVVRFLRDPLVSENNDGGLKWVNSRRADHQELVKRILAERLPSIHLLTIGIRPSGLVSPLIDAIATERAYRLSHTGFDRTALAMLVFILDLATVRHSGKHDPSNPADSVYSEGFSGLTTTINVFQAASHKFHRHGDPLELFEIMRRYDETEDPQARKAFEAEYNAMQDRLARRTSCPFHPQFCVDESQTAAAAIDALLASEGLFEIGNYYNQFTDGLIGLLVTPSGPNPQKYNRVDLRDSAMKLLVRALNPPRNPDAHRQQRREAFAKDVRGYLHGIVMNTLDDIPQEQEAARAALNAGGWGSAEELSSLVQTLLRYARIDAERYVHEGPGWEPRVRRPLVNLRGIAELAASQSEAERAAASEILNTIEELRKRANADDRTTSDELVLRIWDELGARQ